jgi:succinate dehydrogenase / fumarate reductase, flavoprotein subunit
MTDQPYEEITIPVLIIGAGAAGLRTAIELTAQNVPCLVIGKRRHGDAHTTWAAGGINASLGSLDPGDRWEIHAADTLREGHFLNDPKAVEVVCRAAPERVRELQAWGCPFDQTDDGQINQRYFGAQSFRRTCFVGDRTGEAILQTLVNKARDLQIPYRENLYLTKLLSTSGRCTGAIGYDLNTGRFIAFRAQAVVLAAGGHAGIYIRHSSRPDENTGDGSYLAYEAGVALQDMELIQFHPTGMLEPPEFRGRLVTEATRGEGGRLFNKDQERFMKKYSPEHMELDARDVVARAIYREIQEGRGTENGGVWLDISHKGKAFIQERLPKLYERFEELGIDISLKYMEIAPTSHYSMGGVETDFATGRTSLDGLYAVGEVTAGLHGANRLGGNSLVETVALGKVCGEHLAANLPAADFPPLSSQEVTDHLHQLQQLQRQKEGESPSVLIQELRQLMWKHAGITRKEERLQEGLRQLGQLKQRSQHLSLDWEKEEDAFVNALNLRAMLVTAEAVVGAAILRKESRGAHFREDYPESDEAWQKNILCHRNPEGEMQFSVKAITVASEAVQQALAEEHSLDYHHLE